MDMFHSVPNRLNLMQRQLLAGAAASFAMGLSAGGGLAQEMVLTSVNQNIHVDGWKAHSDPGATTKWSVEKKALHGGKQEGVDVVVVDNGKLSFTVVPTRGMSLLRAQMGDVRLGWDSPVTEVVNPQYINLQSRGGVGWLDGFNEWLPRAGIEWAGHPGDDNGKALTLHGKIENIPASEVSVEVVEGESPAIHVRGTVREVSAFGANFELRTDISTKLGSNVITVSDVVTNLGSAPQEFQIIYHANYGEPLLGNGSRFVAAAKEVRPIDPRAAEGLEHYTTYGPPEPGFAEQVYGIAPYGDENGKTSIMLVNAAADKAAMMTFAISELPYISLWKNTGAAGEAYVTGLEPATGFPANRNIERKAGRVPVLNSGASRRFTIDFAILGDAAGVHAAEAEIAAILDGQPTALNPETIKPHP